MIIINGKETSQKIRAELKIKAENLKARFGVQAGLAVVLAGNDPASKIYVTNKVKACAESGVKSFLYELPDTVTESEILELVEHLNNDKSVHGILVQLPLPNGISSQSVISAICPSKDVDGFSPYQAGRLATGNPLLVACTPKAVMELLSRYNICVSGKNAVIIGRSNIVGKPLIHLLLDKNATVTV
ncbi:MAG: bifunctional 5,10-methylenetetrahydrofolate dehydrogenase/5,10-methenyltetrahydrofolate cyclohydrolase, partial [Firmicutes bacterium]|nr:bifunctional 5,10-methylenetetrahydrofolate dehydrogenase/5,10-methenyltetrahydrofolate cyclohydrolase [Bacillota bacterium]